MRFLSLLLLTAAATGCSIEHVRQLGDTCLGDRDCALGLVCVYTPTGTSRCEAPVVIDAGSAPPDAAGDSSDSANPPDVLDAATAGDAAPSPDVTTDGGVPIDTAAPVDLPASDVAAPPDVPATFDVGADADAGAPDAASPFDAGFPPDAGSPPDAAGDARADANG